MAKTERKHLVVSLSPQSDGWMEGPTVRDMLTSGFKWVRERGKEWREELSRLREKLNLQGDPENIPITKELMERVNSIRQEEGKPPLNLPGERWNFNMKYALMGNGQFKVGWGQNVESTKGKFVNGESIVFFWRGGQIVGLYGCAELGDFKADDSFKGNIRAPVEFCVKFDKPLPMDLIVGQRGFRYIDDDKARKLIEKAIREQHAPEEKLRRVYEAVWGREGDEPEPGSKLLRYFAAKGFHFTPEQVTAFYAALKTKGFVILSGLSGTGKTKLAQLFAGLFTFEREVEPEIGKDEIVLTVQPYMLKYRRFIIPVGYWHLLPSLNVGEELSVEVTVEGTKETCRLKRWEHPAHERGYMQLLLRGTVAAWFANNLKEGDRFSLQFDYDENGNLRGITISRVQKVKIKEPACCFLSVRPDWRDSKALLGYYNPLTEGYESTPLLEFLLQAARDYEQNGSNAQPYFVILDEMNLAHVEYYFADFLSVLESGRDDNGWTKEALRLHSFSQPLHDQDGNEIPSALRLPPNLYIIGTVNIDETTYMFSPKVLDRAFTLEFREVDFSDYLGEGVNEEEARKIAEEIRGKILEDLRNGGKFCAVVADKDEVKKALQNLDGKKAELRELNDTLQPYDLHFGYRVLDEIALFVQNATQAPDDVGKLSKSEDEALDYALDYAVLMKVLPKFHGPRQKLETPLWQVLNWCLEEEVSDGSVSPQKVWKQITGEEKQPSGDDITAQLRDWDNIVGKFRYPNTAKKVLQMLRQLYETGFASFAQ